MDCVWYETPTAGSTKNWDQNINKIKYKSGFFHFMGGVGFKWRQRKERQMIYEWVRFSTCSQWTKKKVTRNFRTKLEKKEGVVVLGVRVLSLPSGRAGACCLREFSFFFPFISFKCVTRLDAYRFSHYSELSICGCCFCFPFQSIFYSFVFG